MSKWGDQILKIAVDNPDVRIEDATTPKRERTEAHRQLEGSSEHAEQAALFRWAEYNVDRLPALSLMFAIPNGGQRHVAVAAKLKEEGVKAGVPDIFLPWPSCSKAGLFIEMKYGDNKPTNNQQLWLQRLAQAGYAVAVCYSAAEAINTVEEYLAC